MRINTYIGQLSGTSSLIPFPLPSAPQGLPILPCFTFPVLPSLLPPFLFLPFHLAPHCPRYPFSCYPSYCYPSSSYHSSCYPPSCYPSFCYPSFCYSSSCYPSSSYPFIQIPVCCLNCIVRYHWGGRSEEVNSCVLNSYMVYL